MNKIRKSIKRARRREELQGSCKRRVCLMFTECDRPEAAHTCQEASCASRWMEGGKGWLVSWLENMFIILMSNSLAGQVSTKLEYPIYTCVKAGWRCVANLREKVGGANVVGAVVLNAVHTPSPLRSFHRVKVVFAIRQVLIYTLPTTSVVYSLEAH